MSDTLVKINEEIAKLEKDREERGGNSYFTLSMIQLINHSVNIPKMLITLLAK